MLALAHLRVLAHTCFILLRMCESTHVKCKNTQAHVKECTSARTQSHACARVRACICVPADMPAYSCRRMCMCAFASECLRAHVRIIVCMSEYCTRACARAREGV